uniref:RING-type E3 ubiquitin transferase n=1 Tax=Equus asinus asinus TaxID=83772 RepID=A0A8C4N9R2_EQUAS
PYKLVRAGGCSMGPEDKAKCWCRGLELSHQAAGGSPMQGHHRPHCLCGCILGRDHVDGQILGQLHPLAEEEEEGAGAVAAPSTRPAFPRMGSEELRLASFCHWPLTAVVRPELLAAAGFFHTGWQDKVRCFFCHGGLQSWERGDDPWTEQAKWFPRCEFLLQTKGRDFVCRVQESCCHQLSSWVRSLPSPPHPCRSPPGAQNVEEQLQRLQEERTCKVCLDRAVSVVFVPCGHLVCAECAPNLQICPICRAPIDSCVRTFLS